VSTHLRAAKPASFLRLGSSPAAQRDQQQMRTKKEAAMGVARLNIWITGEGDPCGVSTKPPDPGDPQQWVVAVWECSGRLLNWPCGEGEYFNLPTRCGHLEIEVPPGCYVVRAADSMWMTEAGVAGNHWTDHGVVTACCEETACVTLFAPSAHHCGLGWERVLRTLIERGIVPQDLGGPVLERMQEIVRLLPATAYERRAEAAELKLVEEALGRGHKGRKKNVDPEET